MAGKDNTKNNEVFGAKVSESAHGTGQSNSQFTLKISNINPTTSEEILSELFKTKVNLKEVPDKRPSYAYANYETKADMENGLQYDNTTLDGSHIRVKVHKSGADGPIEKPEAKHFSVKISNINPNTTQETLSQLFRTRVYLKKIPGKPSYAHANYDTLKGMTDALQHDNCTIDDYKIQVKESNKSRYGTAICILHHVMWG